MLSPRKELHRTAARHRKTIRDAASTESAQSWSTKITNPYSWRHTFARRANHARVGAYLPSQPTAPPDRPRRRESGADRVWSKFRDYLPHGRGREKNGRRQVITAAQAKAARKLLKWSKIDVAVRLDIGVRSIAAFERQERLPWDVDLNKLQQIFEAAGVEFADGEDRVRVKAKRTVTRAT
jgi:hypothetical protein